MSGINKLNSSKEESPLFDINQELILQTEMLKVENASNIQLKERMELALSSYKAGVWEWNLLDNSVYCSSQWKEMIGYEDDELPNTLSIWKDRIHPDDREAVFLNIEQIIDAEIEHIETTHRLKHKNGQWMWIMGRGVIEYDQNGQAFRMVGIHTDITDQVALQHKSTERGKILDNSLNEIYIFDANSYNFLYINKSAEKNLGYTLDEIVDLTPLDIKLSMNHETFSKYLQRLVDNEEDHIFFSTEHMRKNGTKYHVDVSIQSTVFSGYPAYVAIILDVSKRKKTEEQLKKQKNILRHQAHHDALSGLPNRVLFTQRLEEGIQYAYEHTKRLALFFIDLDTFKDINDSLGHDVGDAVLKEVATRINSLLGKNDTLARLSGDEFTLIMHDIYKAEDVALLADKILKVLAECMHIKNHMLYVSGSIGISLYPKDATDKESLVKHADTAMYKAKDEGRNNVQFYTSDMTAYALERMEMKTNLRQAIDNDEFVIHYQPQIDAKENTLVGVEALVRWQHPSKGLLLPKSFLLLAEETGLIVELDRWVMRTAMQQINDWYAEGLMPGVLALNLSIKQLEKHNFLEEIKKSIATYNFKPECLELEITEGHMMTKPEDTIAKLKEIDKLGIGISIDDFGTGYSSLSFLKQLPVNRLKIDRSFVKDIPGDEDGMAIVRAIIAMADSLKIDIIAEGVESSGQRDFLKDNGCTNIQGYYYSKAVKADEMQAILCERKWE